MVVYEEAQRHTRGDVSEVREFTPYDPTKQAEGYKSTACDAEAMGRMGRSQELVRNFRTLSMISFVALATSAWETNIFVFTQSLIDGGRPGALYSLLWSFVGFIPIYLSMAEMASMAPIAGAQYHWVSEFAPESCQKVLSYFTGWISTLALQAGNASGFFEVGIIIQAIITVNDAEYEAPYWHATVINLGFILFALITNVVGAKYLHKWQTAVFAIHLLAFLAFIVPVWVNAPTVAQHSDVWTLFENRGGWSSLTLSVLVGQMPGISAHVGMDTATHMAEEVRDASKTIPKIMLVNFAINMLLIFITILTFVYHIPDIPAALADKTEYPGIYVLRQAFSQPWLNIFLVIVLVLEVFGELAYFAAVNRDLYAFARDNGLPFSGWIAKVDGRRNIPTNAYILSAAISGLLSLIYIGSPLAFYAIVSLCTVALLHCYLFSIGCILWRRIHHPNSLPAAHFSLGRWGILVNSAALLFSAWSFFWTFWPESYPVDAAGFNWASPIFGATILIALLYYISRGQQLYHGPVSLVTGRKRKE